MLRKTDNEEEDVKQSKVRVSRVQKVPTDINSDIHNTFVDKNNSIEREDVK